MVAPQIPRIGILALQGCVEPHRLHFNELNCTTVAVRNSKDFEKIDALVLPGGESSTMLKLLNILEMKDSFEKCIKKVPCWGICAGSILLAEKIVGLEQHSFKEVPISVRRNAYGRQNESFNDHIKGYEVAFIRAPVIEEILSPKAEVLSTVNGKAAWLVCGKNMVTTFHPELNTQRPSPLHRYFVEQVLTHESSTKDSSL
jgi:5'-phosphate synthase pdxT subunit